MAQQWTKEQELAIYLTDRNILVSAAAGSGKTAVLVERILELISDGEHPLDVDSLLVVTFTRAAAAQMKDRLLLAMEEKLNTDPDNEHLQKQMTLIHHAQITTIDGFCSYVVRNYFSTIDLDPGFRITDEGEEKLMMQDVLEQVLEEAYESQDEEFLYLSGSLDDLRSDDRLKESILRLFNVSQSHPWPDAWLASCKQPYEAENMKEFLAAPWLAAVEEQVKVLLSEAENMIARAIQIASSPQGPAQYLPALESDALFIEETKKLTGYTNLSKAITSYKPASLSTKKGPAGMTPQNKEKVKQLRDQAKDIIRTKIGETYFFADAEGIFERMRLSGRAVRSLIAITEKFSDRFAQAKRDKNILDFADVEHLALKSLVNKTERGEERTPVAKELSERFSHIMIDEYQDSNLVQEKILTAVSRMDAGIHNIFMVGDVKQSIYKFRLARPELFMEKYDRYLLKGDKEQRIDLHKNFRSRKEVVESVNCLFSRIMTRPLGGIAYDRDAYLVQGAAWPETCRGDYAAELLLMDKAEDDAKEIGSAKEVEAELVADRILKMVGKEVIYDSDLKEERPVRFGDIVILLRTLKGWSDVFARILKARGIPSYSVSRVGYFSAVEVVHVLQFLRLLDNPRQDMSLAAVLTSPIAGLSAEELAMIKNVAGDLPLYECIDIYPEDEGREVNLAKKVTAFLSMYDEIREKSAHLTVREILDLVYERTGYLDYVSAMPAGEQRRANLLMLIDKAIEYEKSSYSGLFHFIRYIDNLKRYEVDFGEAQTAGEEMDMVKIMSIHNSKGLEFPVVVAAGMGKNFNVMDTREEIMVHPDLGVGMPCIDPLERTKEETLYHKMLQKVTREEILGEELRVLYVALTRAKQKLVLTGTTADPAKKIAEAMDDMAGEGDVLPFGKLVFAATYLDWIIPALARTGAFDALARELEFDVITNRRDSDLPSGCFKVAFLTTADLAGEEVKRQLNDFSMEAYMKNRLYLKEADEEKLRLLKDRLETDYAYAAYANMPAKLSVSELKMNHYEETEGHAMFETPAVVPYIPGFMNGTKETAAEGALRGTAYHRFLECLDYEGVKKGVGIREQLLLMEEKGLMTPEDTKRIRPVDMERFMESFLGQQMMAAALKGKLYREQQFFLTVDAGEARPEWKDSGETLLVQGIIDAYFETDEGLVLVDYKTDKVSTPDGSDLVTRYRTQLMYYEEALERLTQKKVLKRMIYSFALHKDLEV